MKPYYETKLGKLYHGDCLEVMQDIPTEHVDLVLTDPPYSSGGAHITSRRNDPSVKYTQKTDYISFCHDSKDQRTWMKWMTEKITSIMPVMRTGQLFLSFVDWRQLPALTDCFQFAGLIWQGVLSWNKPTGRYRPRKGGFAQSTEFVVWGSKGPMMLCDKYAGGSFEYALDTNNKVHPTEKPIELIEELLEIRDGVTMDPFLGSGTTAVACEKLDRRWIGIEISQEYCDIAVKRIKAVENQSRLYEFITTTETNKENKDGKSTKET